MEQLDTGKHFHHSVRTCTNMRSAMHSPWPCSPVVECADKESLMQLQGLILSSNQLVGSLPEDWSSLTSVSPIIELGDPNSCYCCSTPSRRPSTGSVAQNQIFNVTRPGCSPDLTCRQVFKLIKPCWRVYSFTIWWSVDATLFVS